MKKLITLFTLILLASRPLIAQPKPAKAILVQLNSEHNKVSYLLKAHRNEEANDIAIESMAMRKKMIADFTDNFTSCLVYYFIDTNFDLIKNRQFKDILLNADGSIVNNPIIDSADSAYYIIRYGYPDQNKTIRDAQGISVYKPGFIQPDFAHSFFIYRADPDKTIRKYIYKSRKYDIEYFPAAKEINRRIINWYWQLDSN